MCCGLLSHGITSGFSHIHQTKGQQRLFSSLMQRSERHKKEQTKIKCSREKPTQRTSLNLVLILFIFNQNWKYTLNYNKTHKVLQNYKGVHENNENWHTLLRSLSKQFSRKELMLQKSQLLHRVRRAKSIIGTSSSPVSETFSEQNHQEAREFTNPEQELFHPSALLADISTAGNERLPASAETSFTGWLQYSGT